MSIDLAINNPETENLNEDQFPLIEEEEEDDDEESIEDEIVSDRDIWNEIIEESDKQRNEIEEYKQSLNKDCIVPANHAVQYLEDEIFPLLLNMVELTVQRAIDMDLLRHQKSAFNGVDNIAEMLWNLNPRYPERAENWTYIFDMDWVIEHLEKYPRPFYPFSWIWSREYATTKIQAYMRGYWVRRTDPVQEMRQFWKTLKLEKQAALLKEYAKSHHSQDDSIKKNKSFLPSIN